MGDLLAKGKRRSSSSDGVDGVSDLKRRKRTGEGESLPDDSGSGSQSDSDDENAAQLMDMEEFKRENLEDLEKESTVAVADSHLEPFNLAEDLEHGVFDKDGNYIPQASDDEAEEQDAWIGEVEDVEAVAEAQRSRQSLLREKQRTQQRARRKLMTEEALVRLLYCVDKHETIMYTLARYSKLRQTAKKLQSPGLIRQGIDNAIDLLTDLISLLEQKGMEDIYSWDRTKIHEVIKEESIDGKDPVDNYAQKTWDFKWSHSPSKVHGVYSNYEMQHWKQTAFNDNVIVKYHEDNDKIDSWLFVGCLEFM
ncbi:U5 snRNP complex subunit LIN1 KNAG_0K02480 [Huiozyma naganishii CBS 8797]|uniref:GYF domain-containing protein n=1 Tax=Huiozyma naganishii (strain ATCC MYA-139 / BCRC 22969 / CBS 8797 / KCTC 17520 / NBRC 10181 / NCYC 3082 / Yp74L-3) TaxID=1071383 RepID=J7SB00_HUIN7|nr:hypothetical protein KNAG_0K02480 [Kazachstania naganishii CBS 8797]CCK72611.1 hypothetical protein KNAG_0K02480 [Kazachstania naganishii CBS 8797]